MGSATETQFSFRAFGIRQFLQTERRCVLSLALLVVKKKKMFYLNGREGIIIVDQLKAYNDIQLRQPHGDTSGLREEEQEAHEGSN